MGKCNEGESAQVARFGIRGVAASERLMAASPDAYSFSFADEWPSYVRGQLGNGCTFSVTTSLPSAKPVL